MYDGWYSIEGNATGHHSYKLNQADFHTGVIGELMCAFAIPPTHHRGPLLPSSLPRLEPSNLSLRRANVVDGEHG